MPSMQLAAPKRDEDNMRFLWETSKGQEQKHRFGIFQSFLVKNKVIKHFIASQRT